MIALAHTIAEEVTDSEVTANVVLPSLIDTPAFREVVPFANYVDWPTPQQIATVIDFLASPASSVIQRRRNPRLRKGVKKRSQISGLRKSGA